MCLITMTSDVIPGIHTYMHERWHLHAHTCAH
jgi:hypothetical protein